MVVYVKGKNINAVVMATLLYFHEDGICDLRAERFRNGEMLINLASYFGPAIVTD